MEDLETADASQIMCAACGDNIVGATMQQCQQCKHPVHSHVLCEQVWMPNNGHYFCSKQCIRVFNDDIVRSFEAVPPADRPDEGPDLFKVRRRPGAPVENDIPGHRITQRHTGAAYERGTVNRLSAEEREAQNAATLATPGQGEREAQDAAAPATLGQGSPPTANVRPVQARTALTEAEKLQADFDESAKLPWCGQAEKLGPCEKAIMSHYDHRIVWTRKLKGDLSYLASHHQRPPATTSHHKSCLPSEPISHHQCSLPACMHADGDTYNEPSIKYRSKYEPAGAKERDMGRRALNPSRLGDILLTAASTPDDVKEALARQMRSQISKDYVAKLDTSKRAAAENATSELAEMRKAAKVDGSARAKQEERDNLISKYVAVDAAMPKELFDTCFYLMTVFFLLCRVSWGVVGSTYFLRFLWALRPSFVKMMPSQVATGYVGQELSVMLVACAHRLMAETLNAGP